MGACKSTSVEGGVQVLSAALPVTCKLQSPPDGVTIAGAEYYVGDSGTGISCKVSADGQSFVFPATEGVGGGAIKAQSTVYLEVRIQGPFDGSDPVWIVEDCDDQSLIVAVTSPIEKMAGVQVQVG